MLGRERLLTRGDILFRKDDAAGGLYEIEQGQVQLSRLDKTGREVVLHVAGPGDVFAEASLFSDIYHCAGKPEHARYAVSTSGLVSLPINHKSLARFFRVWIARDQRQWPK